MAVENNEPFWNQWQNLVKPKISQGSICSSNFIMETIRKFTQAHRRSQQLLTSYCHMLTFWLQFQAMEDNAMCARDNPYEHTESYICLYASSTLRTHTDGELGVEFLSLGTRYFKLKQLHHEEGRLIHTLASLPVSTRTRTSSFVSYGCSIMPKRTEYLARECRRCLMHENAKL